jgi:hypothetical protein
VVWCMHFLCKKNPLERLLTHCSKRRAWL